MIKSIKRFNIHGKNDENIKRMMNPYSVSVEIKGLNVLNIELDLKVK